MRIAVDQIKNWVFVTGEIRGGTTFVGRTLSLPREVDYIHEPFNIRCGMPGMTRRWQYIGSDVETEEARHIDSAATRLKSYDFTLRNSPFENDPMHRRVVKSLVGTRGPFYLRLAKLNPFHRHAVIKDPTAALLTEHLYTRHGVKPVVVVRHPLSFVASLKRVGWWPSARKLLAQERLVADHLNEHDTLSEEDLEDKLRSAAAHWRLLYKVILNQVRKYPDWTLVRLEDLSAEPVSAFRSLYERLALPWSDTVRRRILRTTQAEGKAEASGNRVQDLNRDSSAIFELRRDALSPEERRTVFECVQDVALRLYSEESFALN